MSDLEREYNKRFHNQKLPNEDFDVEGLWGAVEQELPTEKPIVETKPNRISKLWGLVALLLFVGGCGGWYFSNLTKSQKTIGKLESENKIESGSSIVESDKQIEASNKILKTEPKEFLTPSKIVDRKVVKNKTPEPKEFLTPSSVVDRKVVESQLSEPKEVLNSSSVVDRKVVESQISEPKEVLTPSSVVEGKILESQRSEPKEFLTPSNIVDRKVVETQILENEIVENKVVKEEIIKNKKDAKKETVDQKLGIREERVNIVNSEKGNSPIAKESLEETKELLLSENGEKEEPSSFIKQENSDKRNLEQEVNNTPTIPVIGESEIDKDLKVKKGKLPIREKNNPVVDLLKTKKSVVKSSPKVKKKQNIPLMPSVKIFRKKLDFDYEIGLLGGYTLTNFNFKSNQNTPFLTNKNLYEKSEWGVKTGVQASLIWNKKWMLKTGVEDNRLWTRFDYKNSTDITVKKENELIKVLINNGDTLAKIYGDTIVNADSIKTIIHHNRYQQISIPLELGMVRNLGKFSIGCTAGVALNFTYKMEGKTLYPNEENEENGKVTWFDMESENLPLNTFNLSWRLSPFFAYHPAEKISLQLQPQWIWQLHNSFLGSDLKTHVNQLNLNLGVSYKF